MIVITGASDGLGLQVAKLYKEAVIPHADHEKYKEVMESIAKEYRKDGLRVISLNDNQVYMIDGDISKII